MNKKGFTILEILLVVAVITILAGIVILAINPSRQLALTRNSQRSSDVSNIHKAVYQYMIDNKGVTPGEIDSVPKEICRTGASDCTGLVDLSAITDSSTYLVSMPVDPSIGSGNGTGYMIYQSSSGRPVVYSSFAELEQRISTSELDPVIPPVSPDVCPIGCEYSFIEDAVSAATVGEVITVGPGTYTLNNQLIIEKSLTLRSTDGFASTIIQRDSASGSNHRLLYIKGLSTDPSSLAVIVDGFTFKNGFSSFAIDGAGVGGDIVIQYAINSVVKNSLIESGTADQYGGGIHLEDGGRVEGTIIKGNQVNSFSVFGSGGGVSLFGANVVMDNCIVLDNNAPLGGGVAIKYSNAVNPATIVHSTITNNVARTAYAGLWSGGGLVTQLQSAPANVVDSIIYGNFFVATPQDISQVHLYGNTATLSTNYSMFEIAYPSDPTGSNNLKVDPLFVKSGLDLFDYYSLQSSSPGKDNASDGKDRGIFH